MLGVYAPLGIIVLCHYSYFVSCKYLAYLFILGAFNLEIVHNFHLQIKKLYMSTTAIHLQYKIPLHSDFCFFKDTTRFVVLFWQSFCTSISVFIHKWNTVFM